MDKRNSNACFNSRSSAKLTLFLPCFFCVIQCREVMTEHILTESPTPPQFPTYRNGVRRIMLGIVLGTLTGLICAIISACIVRLVIKYLNRTPILKGPVVFSSKIDPKTLQSALSKENQLLGSSPNGKYYRTVLYNGLAVALKRLEPLETGSPETQNKSVKRGIQQELETLATIRHRNLMTLRAYVREHSRFSLVYDYMTNGSLEDAMNRVRENQLQLGWEIRHHIAVGVIKGLSYLHFSCNPRILHYNLKPTNIMLDADFEPRLADCGLAKLLPNLDRAASSYTAPECFQSCRF
uniref:Protein kinase domain-containing protein n=1 Tax=Nelumbo nucifera TaxID=4432 RepID=A0A822YNI3_NELNU|nr:TPA_asm: hypothetical protein HUJ06_004742 [Nelumbo nucifera]